MVPLESKLNYLSNIAQNAKLSSFYNLVNEIALPTPQNDLKEIDQIYFGVLDSLDKNDRTKFDQFYSQLSKRKIDNQFTSPFIHDDALIFLLIVGVAKYKYPIDWLKNLLNVRTSNNVTATFKAVVENNFFSKTNLHYVVLVFLNLTQNASASDKLLNDAYASVSNATDLFENKNDFLITLALRAYDLVILSKSAEGEVLAKLRQFETRFTRRTKLIAKVFYNVILFLVIYGAWTLLSLSPAIKENVNDIATIVGIFGVQLVGNFFPALTRRVEWVVQRCLGFHHGGD